MILLQVMDLASRLRESPSCVRLYVAGDKTHVGKTTVCLGVLGYLRRSFPASELAYIKPATQCEAPDVLARYCAAEGIAHVAGSEAPIVYYTGFTRAVINGTATVSLEKVAARVDELCKGKKFCLIDGVGFPGVGSCVGASNADLARTVRAPVVLVAKSGVGGAIDAHCQNAAFFSGTTVLGAILNLAPVDGFYAKPKVLPVIDQFFAQSRPRETCYGVIPILPALDGARDRITNDADSSELAKANIDHVALHVDLAALITDASLDVFNRKRHLLLPSSTTTTIESSLDDRLAIEQQAQAVGAVIPS